MIVHHINVKCIALFKPENDAPIAGNRHAPKALHVAAKGMKTISRQIKVRWPQRPVEMRQDVRYAANVICPNSAFVAILVQALQSSMPEAPDHQGTVSCSGTRVNPFIISEAWERATTGIVLECRGCRASTGDGIDQATLSMLPLLRVT